MMISASTSHQTAPRFQCHDRDQKLHDTDRALPKWHTHGLEEPAANLWAQHGVNLQHYLPVTFRCHVQP